MRTPKTLLPLALLAAGLTLAACGGNDSASGGDPGAAFAGATPVKGGTISYGHEQEPPCLIGGWVQQAYIERQFADSLVSQVKEGEIVPWLATKWKVSDDQKTWTFTLKPGVKFTDGTPLNAAAVKTNFETWLNPKSLNPTVDAYIGEYYKSSKALNDTTFELTLTKPYAPLLSALSQGYFGILSPKQLAKGPQVNCEQPVGSGPFIVKKWNRGKNIEFVKNPNYNSAPANAKHQGPAYVDGITWKFLGDQTVRYGSLTSGESNVIYNVPTVNWKDAKQKFEVQQYITPGRPVTFSLNTVKGPFTDKLVRQAFGYAADRKAAVESAFNDVIPYNGNGALSQSTPDYDKGLADAYPYDPEKAAQLLDQAGWKENGDGVREKDGKKLTVNLVYPAGAVFSAEGATALQNIQEQLKQVGFDAKLTAATQSEVFSGKYSTPDSYDAITWYWTSPTAGVLYIVWRQNLKDRPNGNNSSFYNNPTLENTIEKANSTLDPAEQKALYAKAQKIIVDEAAAIGLYTQTTSLASEPKLRDVWIENSQGEPVFHDAFFAKEGGDS